MKKEKPANDKHQDQPRRRNPALDRVTSGILILTAYFVATEHTSDLFDLLLPACSLMHLLDTPLTRERLWRAISAAEQRKAA